MCTNSVVGLCSPQRNISYRISSPTFIRILHGGEFIYLWLRKLLATAAARASLHRPREQVF
jgi:hypothetical protein